MSAATPSEWAAAGSLGLSAISVIALAMSCVDADLDYFDPRYQLARLVESGRVDALLVTVANARFDARESVTAAWQLAALSLRDAAISLAALLALLFPAAGGTR